jgi:hypothetical protein
MLHVEHVVVAGGGRPCRREEWRHVGQLKLSLTAPSIGGPYRPCPWRHAGVAGCHHQLWRQVEKPPLPLTSDCEAECTDSEVTVAATECADFEAARK